MALFSQKKMKVPEAGSSALRPVFIQPFRQDRRALEGLNHKLKNAPSESKHIFRDAIRALTMKAQVHEAVYRVISDVTANYLVLHDLNMNCRQGSASGDFVMLGQSVIISIDCVMPEHKRTYDESFEDMLSIRQRALDRAEYNAYILAESLVESRILPKKIQRQVYPLCVTVERTKDEESNFHMIQDRSLRYPEVYRSEMLPLNTLKDVLESLAIHNDKVIVSEKRMRAAADYLANYDQTVSLKH